MPAFATGGDCCCLNGATNGEASETRCTSGHSTASCPPASVNHRFERPFEVGADQAGGGRDEETMRDKQTERAIAIARDSSYRFLSPLHSIPRSVRTVQGEQSDLDEREPCCSPRADSALPA